MARRRGPRITKALAHNTDLVLRLWKLGYSASNIRYLLLRHYGIAVGRNFVTIIVARARKRGDVRAIIHRDRSGKVAGRSRPWLDPLNER
jgi:hypothetical protein